MNSLLSVITIDILLTLGVVDSPPWIYMLLVCWTVLVFSFPLPDRKESDKIPNNPVCLEPIEQNGGAQEAWDYDYSVYHCKFDVV